jgi:hypothetical protein
MRRRRPREGEVVSTRIGQFERSHMEQAVAKLLGRPIPIMKCPIPVETLAKIWNDQQPQHLVVAIRALDNDKMTEETCGRYKTSGWQLEFDGFKLSVHQERGEDHSWADKDQSPYIDVVKRLGRDCISWDVFKSYLTEEQLAEFMVWVDQCKSLVTEADNANQQFNKLLDTCSTVGQLHRLVPELITLVPEKNQKAFAEQSKRSPMPAGYFELDINAIERMNLFFSKCKLLPEPTRCFYAHYRTTTWAFPLNTTS